MSELYFPEKEIREALGGGASEMRDADRPCTCCYGAGNLETLRPDKGLVTEQCPWCKGSGFEHISKWFVPPKENQSIRDAVRRRDASWPVQSGGSAVAVNQRGAANPKEQGPGIRERFGDESTQPEPVSAAHFHPQYCRRCGHARGCMCPRDAEHTSRVIPCPDMGKTRNRL